MREFLDLGKISPFIGEHFTQFEGSFRLGEHFIQFEGSSRLGEDFIQFEGNFDFLLGKLYLPHLKKNNERLRELRVWNFCCGQRDNGTTDNGTPEVF